jgi:hypothetical protein
MVAIGVIPSMWEGGEKFGGDSILKGMNIWYNQATPLMQSACDGAVGARKVLLIIPVHSPYICDTDTPMLCFEGMVDNNQARQYTRERVYSRSVYYRGERGALASRD